MRRPETTDVAMRRALDVVLERPLWPASLEAERPYMRRQDDCDGSRELQHNVVVTIGRDGDAWVDAGQFRGLRFRHDFGGGQSPRVRAALVVLAEAIRRDNEERPQPDVLR